MKKITALAIALSLLPFSVAAQKIPELNTLSGEIHLVSASLGGSKDECYGTGGFGDLRGGMPVVVKNEQGTIIATSSVKDGERDPKHPTVVCIFNFEVTKIPASKFYTLEIGRRSNLTFSRQELIDLGWRLRFSLH